MRLVVQLRKGGLTAGALAPVVPEDLEASDDDTDEESIDTAGPQTVGYPRGKTAIVALRKATRYRTPKGERTGTPIAYGVQGATIVDHQTGERVRVDHGHYQHDEQDETPSWKKAVDSHLELGPRSRHALHAIAALAADAGVEGVHALRRKDVSVSGTRARVGGKDIDHPAAAATVRWLMDRDCPEEDFWSWEEGGKRQRMSQESLDAYRGRIGALPPPEVAETPKQPGMATSKTPKLGKVKPVVRAPRAAAMRKAATIRAVSELAGVPVADHTWTIGDFTAVLRLANGLPVLSIMGKGLALPFHMIVRGVADAQEKAKDAAAAFKAGGVPFDGVFRAMELGEQMSLFGNVVPKPAVVHVKPHVRQTEHGPVAVAGHDRHVEGPRVKISPYTQKQIDHARRYSDVPLTIARRTGVPIEQVNAHLEGRSDVVDTGRDAFGLSTAPEPPAVKVTVPRGSPEDMKTRSDFIRDAPWLQPRTQAEQDRQAEVDRKYEAMQRERAAPAPVEPPPAPPPTPTEASAFEHERAARSHAPTKAAKKLVDAIEKMVDDNHEDIRDNAGWDKQYERLQRAARKARSNGDYQVEDFLSSAASRLSRKRMDGQNWRAFVRMVPKNVDPTDWALDKLDRNMLDKFRMAPREVQLEAQARRDARTWTPGRHEVQVPHYGTVTVDVRHHGDRRAQHPANQYTATMHWIGNNGARQSADYDPFEQYEQRQRWKPGGSHAGGPSEVVGDYLAYHVHQALKDKAPVPPSFDPEMNETNKADWLPYTRQGR